MSQKNDHISLENQYFQKNQKPNEPHWHHGHVGPKLFENIDFQFLMYFYEGCSNLSWQRNPTSVQYVGIINEKMYQNGAFSLRTTLASCHPLPLNYRHQPTPSTHLDRPIAKFPWKKTIFFSKNILHSCTGMSDNIHTPPTTLHSLWKNQYF